jgi:ribosome-binding factor A
VIVMPQGRRPVRLASQLQEELGIMIQRKLRDPRIGFVTVTRVELTTDLHLATVYFSVLGDESQRVRSGEALHQAAGFLRHELRKNLQLRFVPELRFRFDNRWETQVKLDGLFEQIHQQSAQEAADRSAAESLSEESEEKEPPHES